MKSRFKGILFDFDGTLADTMESHCRAWQVAFSEYGISLKESDYFPLEGLGLSEIAKIFGKGCSSSDLNEIVRKKKEYYIRNHQMYFYPGIEKLIKQLNNKKIPMGIVTAGHLDQLKGSVPHHFLEQFNVIVTGEQFTRGKPHPDPYLRGAKDLGLEPVKCVAIENAPIGVESAKKADIYCIAVCTTVGPDHLSQADEVVQNIEDLQYSPTIQELLNETL